MSKPRRLQKISNNSGDESNVAELDQSAALPALTAEIEQLREQMSSASNSSLDVESALQRQTQAILDIAESISALRGELANHSNLAPEAIVDEPAEDPEPSEIEEQPASDLDSTMSEWERIRSAFLDESEEESVQTDDSSAAVTAAPEPVAEKRVAEEELEPEDDFDELDELLRQLPGATPIPNDVPELKKTLIDRDRTISVLVQRLQKRNRRRQQLSADQLAEIVEQCPEDLANRVEQSLKLLNQQVRLGELELSLERARVSRQLSRLEDTREKLESNARALGLSIGEDGSIEGNSDYQRQTGSKGRRWLGVLGFGN